MRRENDHSDLLQELLGYRLRLTEAKDRARVEAALRKSAELRGALAALDRCLAPLAADEAETPPPGLVSGVLARVRAAETTLPFPKKALPPADVARTADGGPPLALRELVSLAAAILLFVGIFVPGYRTAKNAAQKIACANHLKQVGQGYTSYAEMNGGQVPFVGSAPGDVPWDRGSQRNSRHIWQLVRFRFVPSRAFVCPGSPGDQPFAGSDAARFSGFPDIRNISYATQFMTRAWNRSTLTPAMPIGGDMTPLVGPDRRLLDRRRFPANSPLHGPWIGQNVLRLEGGVGFFRSPRVGPQRDDIYRVIGVDEYDGLERPRQRSDAFLIP